MKLIELFIEKYKDWLYEHYLIMALIFFVKLYIKCYLLSLNLFKSNLLKEIAWNICESCIDFNSL